MAPEAIDSSLEKGDGHRGKRSAVGRSAVQISSVGNFFYHVYPDNRVGGRCYIFNLFGSDGLWVSNSIADSSMSRVPVAN